MRGRGVSQDDHLDFRCMDEQNAFASEVGRGRARGGERVRGGADRNGGGENVRIVAEKNPIGHRFRAQIHGSGVVRRGWARFWISRVFGRKGSGVRRKALSATSPSGHEVVTSCQAHGRSVARARPFVGAVRFRAFLN